MADSNVFNVYITAEKYFKELKLMEQQYGQEEDLYPWIYMLLQETNNNENLSFRMASTGRKANTIPGRKYISGFHAFPDISILDKQFDKSKDKENINLLYCCVEVKPIFEDLIDFNGNIEIKKSRELLRPTSKSPHYVYYNLKDENKWVISNTGNVKHPKSTKELSNGEVVKEECFVAVICFKDKKECYRFENDNILNDYGELLWELLWYGKVIYTNGKHWKFLKATVKNADGEIEDVNVRKQLLPCVKDPAKNLWYKKIKDEKWIITIEKEWCVELNENDDKFKELKENLKKTFKDIKAKSN